MDERMAALAENVNRLVSADGLQADVHAGLVSRRHSLVTNARTTVW
jgi:hypothetical protein